jgi:hypothetical protein
MKYIGKTQQLFCPCGSESFYELNKSINQSGIYRMDMEGDGSLQPLFTGETEYGDPLEFIAYCCEKCEAIYHTDEDLKRAAVIVPVQID